jgi:BirA family biotin operon repressor/biotin-[acetyl-CoA-carboxylase] ligase
MLFRDRAVIRLETIDSTNNYAANLIKLSSPPDGTVITAQEQTNGRGQRGSYWESDPGENLLCSIVYYPQFLNSSNHFYLMKAVALAVRELVEDLTKRDTYIKWPNDIMVQNKKIAGMLVEASWNDQKIQSAVVGIGLNLNQANFEAPHATSSRILNGLRADVEDCLVQLLHLTDKYMMRLQSGNYSEISKQYRENLFRLGQVSQFIYEDRPLSAMITGVDEEGRLRLYTDQGENLTCGLKEIKFVL